MGFKEKMAEHKERQEALQYFRANNDAFMSPAKYLLIFLLMLVMSFVGALIQAVFTLGTGISFGIFYFVAAYLIAWATKKTASSVNDNVIILGMMAYVLMILLTKLLMIWLPLAGFSHLLSVLTSLSMWNFAFKMVISSGVFAWISYILAGYELYMILKRMD